MAEHVLAHLIEVIIVFLLGDCDFLHAAIKLVFVEAQLKIFLIIC
jgi:hypothetical protein